MPDDDLDAILRRSRGLEASTVAPSQYEAPEPLPTDPRAQVPVLAERLQNALRDAHAMRQGLEHQERENARLKSQIQARDALSFNADARIKNLERGVEQHETKLGLLKTWQDKNKMHAAYIAGAITSFGTVAGILVPIIVTHVRWG